MVKFIDKLPEFSFAYLNTTNEVIMIKRGINGYYPQPDLEGYSVDQLNEAYGITKPQAEAMLKGSMFGWHVPASDPDMWENLSNDRFTHNTKYGKF